MKTLSLLALASCYITMAAADPVEPPSYYDKVVEAHGILGCVAWVVFFPLGAIIMRALPSRLTIWVHAAFQMFALALFTANVGMGLWMGSVNGYGYAYYHQIVGLIVFGLAWMQPIGGFLHHFMFGRLARRTIVSHLHIRLGAILITLGILNGGLGMSLAMDPTVPELIAYGAVGGGMWLLYLTVTVVSEHRRDARLRAELLEKSSLDSAS